jgi:hypothetical protein
LRVAKESPSPIPRTVTMTIMAAPVANMPGEVLGNFRSLILTALSQRGFQVTSGKPAEPFVHLSGTVTLYDPENRFGRWFGLARGKFDSKWTIADPKGAELSSARIDGSVRASIFSGGVADVLEEAAQRVADYLAGVRN